MLRKEKSQEQIELFSKTKGSLANERPDRQSRFSNLILSIDSVVMLSIGVILAIIISFSLGVEKGKKITSVELNNSPKQETKQISIDDSKEKQQIKNEEEKKEVLPSDEEKSITAKYVIQVASYKKSSDANMERKKLEKEGFAAIIITSGDWKQVCVGNFSNTKESIPVLNKLRKRYHDCFIKPLP